MRNFAIIFSTLHVENGDTEDYNSGKNPNRGGSNQHIINKFTRMILFPNAKINIGLNILRRRADGYHDIATVMYPIPWTDILEIVPAKGPDTSLTVTGRGVACSPDKNLVMKAYRALDDFTPLPPVDIYLHKIIPDGAGLGGGSADAAFTLSGLNSMFALGLSEAKLEEIAATIGADCPFFISNTPRLCTETGTTMSGCPLSLAGMTVAVVKPAVSVPTAAAYAGVTPKESTPPLEELLESFQPAEWEGRIVNDFEASVFASYPVVGEIKDALRRRGAIYTSMSGSGSAVYALFDDTYILTKGDKLAESLEEEFGDCDVFVGRLN